MKTKHLTLILFASLILTPALHAEKVVLKCSNWKKSRYYAPNGTTLSRITNCENYIQALCDKIQVNDTGTLNDNVYWTIDAFEYMKNKNLPVEKIKALSAKKAQDFFDLIESLRLNERNKFRENIKILSKEIIPLEEKIEELQEKLEKQKAKKALLEENEKKAKNAPQAWKSWSW